MSKNKWQLYITLLGSYFFYGSWDSRFLLLIIFSTLVDFYLGNKIHTCPLDKTKERKLYLYLSIFINLGVLGFFKYFNFFIDSLNTAFQNTGYTPNLTTLNIILPVGISFFTFQSMSYTIDIYRKELKPEPSFFKFATYIAFFPQLVAGPIVRARDFLPQFATTKRFNHDRFILGFSQVLWGLFKKIAVADTLAIFADLAFLKPDFFTPIHLTIGVLFYAIQIYCDFSGYSDIAIGLARIMGFDFPRNFNLPYFSKSFKEFWNRWHISLSSWLKDYLYIPLGGNKTVTKGSFLWTFLVLTPLSLYFGAIFLYFTIGFFVLLLVLHKFFTKRTIAFLLGLNLLATMLIGGLWHGSNWTFVIWGLLHGMYLVVEKNIPASWSKNIPNWTKVGITFGLTCLAWIFFRAENMEKAYMMLTGIFNLDGWNPNTIINKMEVLKGTFLILILFLIEMSSLKFDFKQILQKRVELRIIAYATLVWITLFLGTFDAQSFIYFQF